MGDTSIGWTHRPGTRGRSWNPTQGCALKSEGCRHCYAMRMAARFAKDGWSKGLINLKTGKWNGVGRLAVHKLAEPLSWREPSTVFVNSMSDLFYEAFSNEEIAAVFGIMAACPQHTFQILTKRPGRMREWFEWIAEQPTGLHTITTSPRLVCRVAADKIINPQMIGRPLGTESDPRGWPLPNVWLGVSVEDQAAADERIPELLRTPAAVRFLSCEPLIGPVDLTLRGSRIKDWDEDWKYDTLSGEEWASPRSERDPGSSPSLDWVIVGCESGPGARSVSVEVLRSLRDQCARAGVKFFLKQASQAGSEAVGGPLITFGKGSTRKPGRIELPYLDGVQHAEFPQ